MHLLHSPHHRYFGVTVAAITTSLVLLVNLILIIISSIKFRGNTVDGVVTVYVGDCTNVDTRATYLHVAINALSALLLAASNYTLQYDCRS